MKPFISTLLLVLLIGCTRKVNPEAPTDKTPTSTIDLSPQAPPPPLKSVPTWYVFKIKEFRSVSYSPDQTFATVEGITIQDKAFTVKLVWSDFLKAEGPKSLEAWRNRPSAEFNADIPYVIDGTVLSTDPLTIKPTTLTPRVSDFKAPAENVY